MKLHLQDNYEVLLHSGEIQTLPLKDIFSGNKVVLYFYPKDNTPGCTIENKDFSCLQDSFEEQGYKIVGVSKDSVESHKKFVGQQSLAIDLISDTDLKLHKELGVYGEKNNYGKIVEGVIRSTFLVDIDGEIIEEYRNIRAKGHAERVLKEIKKDEL